MTIRRYFTVCAFALPQSVFIVFSFSIRGVTHHHDVQTDWYWIIINAGIDRRFWFYLLILTLISVVASGCQLIRLVPGFTTLDG